ncbi:hypothetical protein D3C72_2098260 [compost metagenome]
MQVGNRLNGLVVHALLDGPHDVGVVVALAEHAQHGAGLLLGLAGSDQQGQAQGENLLYG